MTGDIDIEQARIWALFGLQDERFRNRLRRLESSLSELRFLAMICAGFGIVETVRVLLNPVPWAWLVPVIWTAGAQFWGRRWRKQRRSITALRAEYDDWYLKTEVMHSAIWPERGKA